MNSFFRKLRWLVQRSAREAELREELCFHLDEEAEQLRDAGLAEDQARWAARRELGNIGLVEENARAAWGWTRLEQFARDAAYGLRQVLRNPLFSGIAIATLALGIGANTAMFSVVDAVLIRPLPYRDADRLVMVWENASDIGYAHGTPSPGTWQEWRRSNTAFTDMAAMRMALPSLSGDGEPEQLQGGRVTASFWTILGSQPLLGRVFNEDEDSHRALVAVISYGLWQRRFGGARDVIGRKITVNDTPFEIIGVMSREFYFLPGRDADIWMPMAFTAADLSNFRSHYLRCVARLRPGVNLRQASESMSALSQRIAQHRGDTQRNATLVPLREEFAGKTETSLLVLLSASTAILLIACVNLANLLLSRATTRQHEVAVRAALGASRRRLVAQFLTESLVLSGLGAVTGLGLARPSMRFLERLEPQTMAAVHLTLDWRVLAFSAAIAVSAAIAFGLAPALIGSRATPQQGLRGGRGSTGSQSHWLQYSLIVTETALAVVLLTGGGLLLKALRQLQRTNLGIRAEKVITMQTPLFRYPDFDKRVAFVNSMLERISAVPGVVSAGAATGLPVIDTAGSDTYLFAGEPMSQARGRDAIAKVVSRDYFTTIGASLREGRFFDSSDRAVKGPGAEMVAIVNETFADLNFPNSSALDARFHFSNLDPGADWYTVVGVVREIRERGVAGEQKPAVYVLHEQAGRNFAPPAVLVVRTAVEPASIMPSLREAIWAVDENEPVARIRTLDDIIAQELSQPYQDTTLLGAFAGLALFLACIGLYGVLSYAVTQRTNEIAVRMALGASSGQILLSFGKRGLSLTLEGLAIGLGLAAIATRSMTNLLYGFRPDYIPTVTVVSLTLLAVAALACFVPARRASRVDPVVALRN